jgi:2-methylisocitrate lyase-like PEP mutase family enzyme
MSDSADERRARFRALHEREQLFVMPNPWDIGSARLLASAGFEALATTSAGFAWSLGRLDQNVSRGGGGGGGAARPARTSQRSPPPPTFR